MRKNDSAQILGALLLSFGQACINFQFLITEDNPFLTRIKPDAWYPLDKFSKILSMIKKKYSDPSPILERIGIEMMNQWYLQGPGKEIIKKGTDFLHFQTSSEGYYSVIRGRPDQIGNFSLLSLDEEKGTAAIRSTTPFDRDMERGVLIGGMRNPKDLLYVKVDNSDDGNTFHIRFQHAQVFSDNAALSKLQWQYKMLEDDFKRQESFWRSTNANLTRAFEKLGYQGEQLQKRSAELLRANTMLKKEIADRKQAQKRIELLNQLKEKILGSSGPDEKFRNITEGIVSIFSADFARIWIIKPGDLCESGCFHARETDGPHVCRHRNLCLRLIASSGRYTHLDGEVHRRVPFDCYKIGRIASGDIAKFITNDVTHDSRVHNRKWAKELGLVSFAGYRLLSSTGIPIGVLALFSKHILSPEDNGLLEGLANTTTQIVQTVKAEEELKMYQVMIESAQDAIFYKDLKSRYLNANDKTLEAFGLSKEEVLGKDDYELMPDQKEARQNVLDDQAVFKSGQTKEFHKHMTGADHQEYWFQAIKVPRFDNDGKVIGLVGIARDITELKRVESALRESETLYHSLVENLPQYIFRKDLEGRYTFVNHQFCQREGKASEKFLGKTDLELYPPELAQRFRSADHQVINTGKIFESVDVEYAPEGNEIYTQVIKTPVYDAENRIIGIQGIFWDITELKRVENALRESEAELRALFNGLPDVVIMLDQDGRYLKIAPTSPDLLYRPEEELHGKRLHNTFPKELADIFLKYIKQSLATQELVKIEYSLAIGGNELWFDGRIAPMSEHSVVFVARDITARKRAEETLRKSEEKHRVIFENANDIIIIAQDGRIAFANPALNKILGYSDEEVVSKPFTEFIHPDDQQMVFERYKKRMAGEEVETGYQFRVLTSTGDIRWVIINSSALDWDGKPSTLNFLTDITERKKAEEAVIAAKEQAEAANQAKSTFLANMSHELRTPLNSILGYTQILERDRNLRKDQKNALNTIHQSSEHLLTLINELLDLSRIEAKKMELDLSAVHLPGLLKGIIENARIWAEQKGIVFKHEIDRVLPKGIRADEKRLRQVLLNLINNAIKFTEKGRVVLRVISTPPIDATAKSLLAMLRFEIEDSGIGISPDKLEEIFLPFQQVNQTNLGSEGTGLGLPISRNLLQLMDSELHVKSALGAGTTFWFELEFNRVELAPESKFSAQERQFQSIIGFKGKRRKIMIADDNEKNRALLRDMLLPLGFKIEVTANGKEALNKIKKFNPELILMDLVMPVMDGLEATRRIRKDPALKNIIIIGISASAFDTTKQSSFKAGCNDFLTKPIHINKLLDRLKVHLKLVWLYEDTKPDASKSTQSSDMLPFIVPPKEDLVKICKFAEISHITGVQQTLEKIKGRNQKYLPFILQIEELLDGFQFREIKELLKHYLKGTKS